MAHERQRRAKPLRPASCLLCNSCDGKGWDDSEAARILQAIEAHAVTELAGWDDAAWGLPPEAPHYVETRADGFPWTREAVNPTRRGKLAPYDSKEEAEAAIASFRKPAANVDPMFQRAEYRAVPA